MRRVAVDGEDVAGLVLLVRKLGRLRGHVGVAGQRYVVSLVHRLRVVLGARRSARGTLFEHLGGALLACVGSLSLAQQTGVDGVVVGLGLDLAQLVLHRIALHVVLALVAEAVAELEGRAGLGAVLVQLTAVHGQDLFVAVLACAFISVCRCALQLLTSDAICLPRLSNSSRISWCVTWL